MTAPFDHHLEVTPTQGGWNVLVDRAVRNMRPLPRKDDAVAAAARIARELTAGTGKTATLRIRNMDGTWSADGERTYPRRRDPKGSPG